MSDRELFRNMVRTGKVQSYDGSKGTARVKFEDLGDLLSGELCVLQHVGTLSIDQLVLCIYPPIPDADGFVVGVI
jgi:hypothetical protein